MTSQMTLDECIVQLEEDYKRKSQELRDIAGAIAVLKTFQDNSHQESQVQDNSQQELQLQESPTQESSSTQETTGFVLGETGAQRKLIIEYLSKAGKLSGKKLINKLLRDQPKKSKKESIKDRRRLSSLFAMMQKEGIIKYTKVNGPHGTWSLVSDWTE